MLKTALHRLAKGSLIYGLGGMLQRFMGLLLLPFYTRALNPQDYGVIALVSLVGVAMNGVLTLGTGNSMGLLYYREQDKTKRSTIIWTNVLLMVVNGMLWYFFLFMCAPALSAWFFQTSQYAQILRIALLGCVFGFIVDPLLAFLRMEEKASEYVTLTLISSFISIALSIYLVLIEKRGVVGVIVAGTVAQGIMVFVSWGVVGRKLPYGIDLRLIKPLVSIGFPSIFGLFAFLLIDYADRQMIERMLGLFDLGVYSIGYSFGMVMMIAVGAFGTAWSPFFMSYINKHDEARKVFALVLTYYVLSMGSIIVLFFYVSKPVTLLMTASTFHEAWIVIGLVAGSYALKGCYLIVLPGIYFSNKLYYQSIIEWVAALINIGLNLLLIQVYGILGAAIATFVSYLSLPILAWSVAHRYLDVDYQWRRIGIWCASVAFTSMMLYQTYRQLNGGVYELLLSVMILVVFFAIAYECLLTRSERDMIRQRLSA